MKFFVDNKEVTLKDLKEIQYNLFLGSEAAGHGYTEVLTIDEIVDDSIYFCIETISWY